jgi:SH3 domain-containing protein
MIALSSPSRWIVLGFFMSLIPPLASAQTFVTTRSVRLRGGPSTVDRVLKILKTGERVTLLTESGSGDFFRVRTERAEEGWVHGRYLVPPWTPYAATTRDTEAATTAYPACGGEHHYRWAAKTDLEQSGLTPQSVSIPALLQWVPLGLGQDLASWCAPRRGRELEAFAVTGWVRRVRQHETDGDWHVEITASSGTDPDSCIVVEIPDPTYDTRFSTARDALDSLLQGSAMSAAGDITPPVRVQFVGAAFYDGWHSSGTGARGHGRCNSSLGALWEIHPVFSVTSP